MGRFDPRCYPCALRRALCTAEKVSDDAWLQHKVLDEAMRHLSDVETHLPPAEVIGDLLGAVHDVLGTGDPWKKQRDYWVQEMVDAYSDLKARVIADDDPLGRALLMSARSNVFANEIQSTHSIRQDLQKLGLRESDPVDLEFRHDDRSDFEKRLEGAKRLVFVHDTAPEVATDLILIDQLLQKNPQLQTRHLIKRSPLALHDMGDLFSESGPLRALGEVISIGNRLGLSADEWEPEVAEVMESADLILLKGASHLQTLESGKWPAFGLFRAKCPVTAASYHCSIGDLVFVRF